MKTAYELAMERLGGTHEYTEDKKSLFAEVDSRYDAKIAEARLGADERLANALGDPEKTDEIRRRLAADINRLQDKREAEKQKIRGN